MTHTAMYDAKIILDSISPAGVRLTTLQITFPRFVLAEFNTHRSLSRNSASSRAIPVLKRIAAIEENPFVPEAFAANKRGMQAGEQLSDQEQTKARETWLASCREALAKARELAELGVHKQWANRLIEPYAWHTVIVTATEWDNYFGLRAHPDAQPEIQIVSRMMKEAMDASVPAPRLHGQWHLPFFGRQYGDEDLVESAPRPLSERGAIQVSVARCARVSYLTHDGRRDIPADRALYSRLASRGHMSPLEHAARPMTPAELAIGQWCGNFRGWVQHRKEIPGEAVFVHSSEGKA